MSAQREIQQARSRAERSIERGEFGAAVGTWAQTGRSPLDLVEPFARELRGGTGELSVIDEADDETLLLIYKPAGGHHLRTRITYEDLRELDASAAALQVIGRAAEGLEAI